MISDNLRPLTRGPSALVAETAGRTDSPAEVRTGVVSSVSGDTVNVSVAGGIVVASHLASYTPTVDHRVLLLKVQDSWVVLGRILGPGT